MMFKFIKKCFLTAMTIFSCGVLSVNTLKGVSMSKRRSEIVDVNSNEPLSYPYSIKINKCRGSCNSVNDPYAKLCVPDTVKDIDAKVLNLMPRANETRHIEWYETCKCKCRSDTSVCNNKHRWNEEKCRCECKELIGKGICDKEFTWNPSNCEYEYDKSCDIKECLDYKNCKCRNKVLDKLVEKCSQNIDGNEMLYNKTLNEYNTKAWSSCTCSFS